MMLTLSPLRALHEKKAGGEGEAPKFNDYFFQIEPPPHPDFDFLKNYPTTFLLKNGPPCTIFVVYYATYMYNDFKKDPHHSI